MKKKIAPLLMLVLLLSLTACAGQPAAASSELPSSSEPSSSSTAEPTPTPLPVSSAKESATQPEPIVAPEEPTAQQPTTLVLYFDYSENMGDTSAMTADAITSASLAGDHPDGVAINNLLVMADEIRTRTGADLFSVRVNEPYDPDYGEMVGVAQQDQNENKQFTFVEDIDLSGYDTIFIGMPVWWSKLPQPPKQFVESRNFSGKAMIPFGIHRGSRFGQMVSQLEDLTGATVSSNGLSLNALTSNDQVRAEVSDWLVNLGA